MTLVLRVIRQHRWDSPGQYEWLGEGDIPADPLSDIADTSDNCLSVWFVDNEKEGLERVLAALAANRDKAGNLDYMLFAQSHLEAAGIEFRQTSGATPDKHVNEQHRDLTHLSATKVLALTERVWHDHREPKRVKKSMVIQLVAEGVRDRRISTSRLRPELLADVRRYLEDKADEPPKPR
ncbi:MAG: hypothetical protein ABIP48_21335 [Planctomycetota bacterium]